ncbi:hypothetical protein BKA62DRAFT_766898 [Auriculariales sp. MPI-PUGE-AT-0066]|nr:hypothetical protein BKA62DRAFT_766898 [Auriculariales sp. MPI-PUGE-AT-0066]
MSSPSLDLNLLLRAAVALTGVDGGNSSTATIQGHELLKARLQASQLLLGDSPPTYIEFVESTDLACALQAASMISRIQLLVQRAPQSALLGSRDWSTMRALFDLMLLRGRLLAAAPPENPVSMSSSPTSPEYTHIRHRALQLITNMIISVVDEQPRTEIGAELLRTHLSHLFRFSFELSFDSTEIWRPEATRMQETTESLLASLPTDQTITALISLLASPPIGREKQTLLSAGASDRVRKFLSLQLLREDGVRGLFVTLFGDLESSDDAPFDRMERIATILCTVPAQVRQSKSTNMAVDYFTQILAQLFVCLDDAIDLPPCHRRAAAFTISQMLDPNFRNVRISRPLILRTIHLPLLPAAARQSVVTVNLPSADGALRLLISLITRMDPSPLAISALVAAVVPSIVGLLEHFASWRTTDPELLEGVRGVLLAWGRVATMNEVVSRLWTSIIRIDQLKWEGSNNSLRQSQVANDTEYESLGQDSVLGQTLGQDATTNEIIDANPFMLRPDPNRFATMLKDIGRDDVAGQLFIQCLEVYHASQPQVTVMKSSLETIGEADPRRSLLYLQLALCIQRDVPEAMGSLAKQPDRLLKLVHTVLGQSVSALPQSSTSSGLTLEDLCIVDSVDGRDSDDDDEPEDVNGDLQQEMTRMILSVLLSVLELHESLLPLDSPQLQELSPLLARLSCDSEDQLVQRLAREAEFVLRARMATGALFTYQSAQSEAKTALPVDAPQVIYQRALQLLIDPLLPVRAAGLAELRTPAVLADPALRPGVLDALLRTIDEGESFLYLNAIQGLVAIALTSPSQAGTSLQAQQALGGKDVLSSLLRGYATSIDAPVIEPDKLDRRLRLGEALSQVIIHLQTAVAIYVDTILPWLFSTIRATGKPIALRSSAMGLLAQCIQSAGVSYALSKHSQDIAGICIDILRVETEHDAPIQHHRLRPTLDEDATSSVTKQPPLRRSAAHVATVLLRAEAARGDSQLDREQLRGMLVVLDYVATTDQDELTKAMCREAIEGVADLARTGVRS